MPFTTPVRRLVLVLLMAAALDGIVAKMMSQTMDEGDHIGYGVKILQGEPDRSYLYLDSKTPITALNALPRVVAEKVEAFPRIRRALWSLVRFPSILAALAVIILIYRFASEWYGARAAWVAAILAALSPNLIAHGTIATTDGYFAASVLMSCYFLRRYLLNPTSRNAFISALALALAQLAKPMAIYLYLITGIFVILAMVRPGAVRLRAKDLLIYSALVIGLTIAVLNVAYTFDRTLTPWGSYSFESASLKPIRHAAWLENIPVPFPYPVLQGFDKMLHTEQTGETGGDVYLLGELRRVGEPGFHNFKSYYL
ncbi:MAG TPA: glycosyltransferase family 39 protein, partial [Terriglobia bacterium]|nr:glycosyltransferase family 39 protein [Terriglobia bacterium]